MGHGGVLAKPHTIKAIKRQPDDTAHTSMTSTPAAKTPGAHKGITAIHLTGRYTLYRGAHICRMKYAGVHAQEGVFFLIDGSTQTGADCPISKTV